MIRIVIMRIKQTFAQHLLDSEQNALL